jgi:hypothetical protein
LHRDLGSRAVNLATILDSQFDGDRPDVLFQAM